MSTHWIPPRAGVRRRGFAFLVDSLLLAGVGLAIGFPFAEFWATTVPWGRLVGGAIALLYFGILNGASTGGRTPGKRLVGIRVVALDGTPVATGRSFLRALVLVLPWTLNGAQFQSSPGDQAVVYLTAVVVFGALLANAWLIVFNRANLRVLHDLLLGTIVVRDGRESTEVRTQLALVHRSALAVIVALSLAIPGVIHLVGRGLAEPGIHRTHERLMAMDEVGVASVMVETTWVTGAANPVRSLEMWVNLTDWSADDDDLKARMLTVAYEEYPECRRLDRIEISIAREWDLAIASGGDTQRTSHTPTQWDGFLGVRAGI